MTVRIDSIGNLTATMDWRRIAALGSSFAAHLVAAALIAWPLATPLRRDLPKIIEATLTVIEPPPPPLHVPPEPVPPPRAHPHQVPIAAPTTAAVALTAAPAPIATTLAKTAAVPDPDARSDAPAGTGETRVLAYAGALPVRYPPASVRTHEQGTVVLRVLVDARGTAQRIEIARSSGHARLDAAAREAIEHARFLPVMRNGEAIPAWGLVPIAFRLDRA